MMPACRIPPPSTLRSRWASRISSAGPASAEPTGAPSPLEKQIETVSKCRAHSRRRDARGHHGVHQPGAVEVHGQPWLARPGRDLGDVVDRVDPAAAAVVRVLQADQPGPDVMAVVGPDLAAEHVGREQAAVALDRSAVVTPQSRAIPPPSQT